MPVTPTTLKEVLSQRAYMLFYVKRSLAYAQPFSRSLAVTAAVDNPATDHKASEPPSGHGFGSQALDLPRSSKTGVALNTVAE